MPDRDGPPFARELTDPTAAELVVVQGVNPPTKLITSASGQDAPPFAPELIADRPPHHQHVDRPGDGHSEGAEIRCTTGEGER